MKVKQTIVSTGIVLGSLAIVGGLVTGGEFYDGANALTYQDEVDVEFNFEASMGITFSEGDLNIGEVAPGNSSTSSVTVRVSSNSTSGYILTATAGNGTDYTDARLKNAVDDAYIAGMATAGALPTSGSTSYWGYKTGEESGVAQYAALPYMDETAVVLNKTVDLANTAATGFAGGTETVFEVGAFIAEGQMSGDYTNVVNFITTANVVTP